MTMDKQESPLQCICKSRELSTVLTYDQPPAGEIVFSFINKVNYYREVKRCNGCGHFISVHNMDIGKLYEGDYVSSNYGDDGILKTFNKINALPSVKSDNIGRVKKILEYVTNNLPQKNKNPFSVLDVGSGLCVFLYRMKEAGWDCTALDPDIRSVKHAEDVVGVKAVCGNFMEVANLGKYDLITFNRVLEHVGEPRALLQKSSQHLKPKGFVYIEVPDGEKAIKYGKEREEFTIDHIHIFSKKSLELLIEQSGFEVKLIERLQEPSSKYTLRAFIVSKNNAIAR